MIMKKETILKIAKIGAGLGLLWYGVLRGAKSLAFRVYDYSISTISLSDGTAALNLNLLIKNPLLVGVKIRGIVGDVYAQGVLVGAVNMKYDYYLAGGKQHIIPIIVNMDLSRVGEAVMANIASGDINTLQLRFNGKVAIGDYYAGIPVNLNMSYKDLVK